MSYAEPGPYAAPGADPRTAYPQPSAPAYAHWGKRVGATLVDLVATVPFYVLIVVVAISTHSSTSYTLGTSSDGTPQTVQVSNGISGLGWALIALLYLGAIAFAVWNLAIRQGRTGRSLGKSALGITLVREGTGEVTGVGLALGRQLLHVLDSFFYVGFLWPLWDDKRQTFADKICSTVVLDGPRR